MGLQDNLMAEMKTAMKAKNQVKLTVLRAIKAEILKFNTSGEGKEMDDATEITLLSKMLKQRKDAASIYQEQGREDLAKDELDQAAIISEYLPKQMSAEELETAVKEIVSKVGAAGPQDMGKVMGMASGQLKGKAEGKDIANMVKTVLGNL
ncbi:MAG: GatB/YqeY domain-containing protein [Flavobacteriales bacterium]|jgi:uncharacterized protein YqeY|nr:GatB/YqeY domain-containing protein [Flavobacteriales bacterium]